MNFELEGHILVYSPGQQFERMVLLVLVSVQVGTVE